MNDTPDGYIARLKEGSYEVFSDLYAHYSNRLYGFAMAQTKNNALAEDIVQEAFLKLWNTRQQLDCYGNVHALLFTIARNLIIDGFRNEGVESGSVCCISTVINWEEDEEFLTPLGFTKSNDGTILLNGLDYQDSLNEEIMSKARDILSYYLESYEELKTKC